MASIRSSIELQDNFTRVLYGVVDAVNIGLSAMEDLNQTMNEPVNTAGLEAARQEMNQLAVAAAQLQATYADVAPPSTAPAAWQSDSVEIFTTTGSERFAQEIQSAKGMLDTLNQTQMRISQTAAGMDILPNSATVDITSLQTRLNALQQKIIAIESNPMNIGTESANAGVEELRQHLASTLDAQEALNQAIQSMDVSKINSAYLRLSGNLSRTEQYIRDNTTAQGAFNRQIAQGTSNAGGLMGALKGAVSIYAVLQGVKSAINASDELTQTTARLNLMNDGAQTTDELLQMVYQSAQNARGSLTDMASVVARFGNNAGDAFGSSAEVVQFAELIQKQMTVAGASSQEASNAMIQLSQGLGAGALRGEELNSVLEQAPNIVERIADYMGVTKGEIKDLAAEGQITADVVKNAMFTAADEIDKEFESMPMTWAQVWQSIQNTATMAFQPVLNKINEIANSEGFQSVVSQVTNSFYFIGNVAAIVIDGIARGINFIGQNWSVIAPILAVVGSAIMVLVGAIVILNAVEKISNGLKLISAARSAIKAGASIAEAAATETATGAQIGLNAAILASPITWIVVAVVAFIVALIAFIHWVLKSAGAVSSAGETIMGIVYVVVAFVKNLLLGVADFLLGIINFWVNKFIDFANFIANVFRDPIGSVITLFSGMADRVLGIIESIARAIDNVFGSNLADAVSGWRGKLEVKTQEAVEKYGNGKYEEVVSQIDLSTETFGWERTAYGDAWDNGVAKGAELSAKMSELFNPGENEYEDIGTGVDEIAGSTSEMADTLSGTSSEELEYLRMIAEREAVNRYTTAEIKLDFKSNATIASDIDIDGFVNTFTDEIGRALVTTAAGLEA